MNTSEQGLYYLLDVHLLDKCGCMRSCCYTAPLEGGVSAFTSALKEQCGVICAKMGCIATCYNKLQLSLVCQHRPYNTAGTHWLLFWVNGVTEVKLQLSGTAAVPAFSSVVINTV